jgi:alkylation response protein AidB-like acyl-CoA dehydrogenase
VHDEHGGVEPVPRMVLLPMTDVVIEETWCAAGLKATGSHHVSADAVRVDLARSCTFFDRPWADGPLWHMPLFTILAPVLVAAPLGIARGALDHLMADIRDGTGGGMRGLLVNDPAGLAELAAADAALRAAYAGVVHALEEVWTAAVDGERATRPVQARVLLAVHHALDTSVDATSTAHRLAGGAAAYAGHRLLTALNDVLAARQHRMFAHQHRPALMRIAAGIDESMPPHVI